MSTWAQIAGIIQVNCARGIEDDPDFEKILGKMILFDSDDDPDDTHLPWGTEGSLQYHVIEAADESSLSAFTIPIWGSLRSYTNYDYIKKWFTDVCMALDVRNAVLDVKIDRQASRTLVYKEKLYWSDEKPDTKEIVENVYKEETEGDI